MKFLMLGYPVPLQVCEGLPEAIAMLHAWSALKTRHRGVVVYLTSLSFRHSLRYKFGMRDPYFLSLSEKRFSFHRVEDLPI
jgi:hypothetical protein